ncbi:hypothetical protein DH2020_014087 [Rehmannia glutinosa]|uniref:Protein YIP n=1 Tax=Rehmannia glutinosa TaxID=99300 RepID=A0ABR0WYH6_REHGL
MSHSDTIPLHPSSQSDIDEIENLINSYPSSVLPARPPSPPRASIPVSSNPLPPPSSFVPSNLPPPSVPKPTPVHSAAPSSAVPKPPIPPPRGSTSSGGIAGSGFGPAPNTLTEPVWDTIQRDLSRIVSNLKLVVFPNPFREDPGKALRDWDLWGPFFFIVFLGLVLSWSASVEKHDCTQVNFATGGGIQKKNGDTKKSEVFAVAFALLAAGAVILTLNVLLLLKWFRCCDALAWSTWAAYPFMSTAVNPRRKALALYPVLLMYVSVGFLIIAID